MLRVSLTLIRKLASTEAVINIGGTLSKKAFGFIKKIVKVQHLCSPW